MIGPFLTELLLTEAMVFSAAILFVYWAARTLLVLTATQEEIDSVLEADVWWARRFWLTLRVLLSLGTELSA